MPKRISAIDRQRLSLANILQRLPLQRQLGAANAAVIKLSPVWQKWAKNHLATEFIDQVQLSCVQTKDKANELVITCPHAICASQLKHQKENLLMFLNKSGVQEIERIKIRLVQNTHENLSQNESSQYNSTRAASQNNDNESTTLKKSDADVSPKSLESIETCQQSVSNTRLAESLSQLATTLRDRAKN